MKSKSIQTTIATGMVTGTQLLAGIQIARILGPYSRGELSLLTAWAPVFAVIFSGGITDALSHQMGQTKDPKKKMQHVSSALLLILILSLVGFSIGYVFTEFFVNQKLPQYAGLALCFLLVVPLTNISNMNVALDLAQEKVNHYNFSRIVQSSTYLLATIYSLYFMKDPIPGIVAATLLQCTIPIGLNLKTFMACLRLSPSKSSLAWIWKHSLPIWPGVALIFLATQADRLAGTLFLKFNDLGIFHVAQSLSLTALGVLSYTPYLLILPAASQIEDLGSRRDFLVQQISFWNVLLLLFTVVVIPVGYFVAPLLLGEDFKATGLAIAILAPGHAALMSRMTTGRSLRSLGHASIAPVAEFLFLALLAISATTLHFLGDMNWLTLAIATGVSSCLSTIGFFLVLARRLETPIGHFLQLRKNCSRLLTFQ